MVESDIFASYKENYLVRIVRYQSNYSNSVVHDTFCAWTGSSRSKNREMHCWHRVNLTGRWNSAFPPYLHCKNLSIFSFLYQNSTSIIFTYFSGNFRFEHLLLTEMIGTRPRFCLLVSEISIHRCKQRRNCSLEGSGGTLSQVLGPTRVHRCHKSEDWLWDSPYNRLLAAEPAPRDSAISRPPWHQWFCDGSGSFREAPPRGSLDWPVDRAVPRVPARSAVRAREGRNC